MRIFIAQVKPKVGSLEYNFKVIEEYYNLAIQNKADVCIFPELVTTGYTPEDLLLKQSFILDIQEHIENLIHKTGDTVLLLPTPLKTEKGLENSVLVIQNQKIIGQTSKRHLANYRVFDEKRYFCSGEPKVINIKGKKVGIPICEDLWFPDVAKELKAAGAEIFIVPNASPFEEDKYSKRLEIAQHRYLETSLPIIYCNQVLGQDGIIYDGRSFGYDNGQLLFLLKPYVNDHTIVEFKEGKIISQAPIHYYSTEDLLYGAMVFGLKEYVINNGFKKVVLGLSGGVDSALVASIAADALGPSNVNAIMLPFVYTSRESLEDAEATAILLGINYRSIGIKPIVDAAANTIDSLSSLAYENLQARIRGLILMSISNTTNELVLTTGNKSENAVGYATLYGDMCGAFNPIKDLYKSTVFKICWFRNSNIPKSIETLNPITPVIPERVITKPPSAELRENQKDSDSLPDYAELDLILKGLIEEDLSLEEMVEKGFNKEKVQRVIGLLHRAEYKRRQSAPGVKLTSRALDKDRRYPITLSYSK